DLLRRQRGGPLEIAVEDRKAGPEAERRKQQGVEGEGAVGGLGCDKHENEGGYRCERAQPRLALRHPFCVCGFCHLGYFREWPGTERSRFRACEIDQDQASADLQGMLQTGPKMRMPAAPWAAGIRPGFRFRRSGTRLRQKLRRLTFALS